MTVKEIRGEVQREAELSMGSVINGGDALMTDFISDNLIALKKQMHMWLGSQARGLNLTAEQFSEKYKVEPANPTVEKVGEAKRRVKLRFKQIIYVTERTDDVDRTDEGGNSGSVPLDGFEAEV